jgi:hypothetical protein
MEWVCEEQNRKCILKLCRFDRFIRFFEVMAALQKHAKILWTNKSNPQVRKLSGKTEFLEEITK